MRKTDPDHGLDRTDFAILTELQNDARLSNKELASRVHLAPSSCLERVRRLRDNGVITGFHASVDPHALGIELQAMIAVRLDNHSAGIVREFQDAMRAHPAVIATYYLAGRTDFVVHVAVRDTRQLRSLAIDDITARPEVANVETLLIFDHHVRPDLPCYAEAGRTRGDD